MSNKKQHGGKRAGAGRKTQGKTAKKGYSFALEPALIAALDTEAKRQGISRSQALEAILIAWQSNDTEKTVTGHTRAELDDIAAKIEASHEFDPDNNPSGLVNGTDYPGSTRQYTSRMKPILTRIYNASEFRSKLGPNANQAFRGKFEEELKMEKYPNLIGKKPGQMRHDHQPKLMATLIAYGVIEVDLAKLNAMDREERQRFLWALALKHDPQSDK